MTPPVIEPMANIVNIAVLLWPVSNNAEVVNSVGIGITDDIKLLMNRPIKPSFIKKGLLNIVLLPIVNASTIINDIIGFVINNQVTMACFYILFSSL